MVVFVEAVLIVLSVLSLYLYSPFFVLISVELRGSGITIVDHPLLSFLSLLFNIAVLIAAMLLLSFIFLSDIVFFYRLHFILLFFSKFLLPTWVLQPCPLLYSVNSFSPTCMP